MSLYVNGALAGTWTNSSAWNAGGPLNIGCADADNYFPGMISNVQAWNYAVTTTKVTALYRQIK